MTNDYELIESDVATQPVSEYPKQIELPSGSIATIPRQLKGRDQVKATRFCNGKTEELMMWLLVCVGVQVDGVQQQFEDLLDLDLADLLPIQEALTGKRRDNSTEQT